MFVPKGRDELKLNRIIFSLGKTNSVLTLKINSCVTSSEKSLICFSSQFPGLESGNNNNNKNVNIATTVTNTYVTGFYEDYKINMYL